MCFDPNDINSHSILAHAIRQQRVILFTGAGFSCEATNLEGKRLGTGNDLKIILAQTFLPNLNLDKAASYQLDELCEYILSINNFDSKDMQNPLNVFLRSFYSDCTPEKYHYLFNKFRWRRIFTTNIDDIMEKVFSRSGENYLRIHNSSKKEKTDDPRCTPFYKLHGCVRNINEPFIFTIREYVKQMAHGDFRYDVFANDFGTEIFLFMGTALNERNLELFLEKKQRHNLGKRENEVFIVTLDDDPLRHDLLKSKYGAVVISSTTQQFIEELDKWCLGQYSEDPPPIEDEILVDGFIDVRKEISEKKGYPSKFNCFLGAPLTWEEAEAGAYINRNRITEFVETGFAALQERKGMLCIITGKNGCGKSTALKIFTKDILSKCDHYILEWFSTDEIPVDDVFAFISRNTRDGYVTLIIDDAAIHYHHIGQLMNKLKEFSIGGWLIVAAERIRNHNQNSILIREYLNSHNVYNLTGLQNEERLRLCEILEHFKVGYPAVIKKIKGNSFDKSVRIDDISAMLSAITDGHLLEKERRTNLDAIKSGNRDEWHFLLGIAILDFLSCRKVPSVILDKWINNSLESLCRKFEDVLNFKQVRSNLVTISTINSYYTKSIVDMASFDEMMDVIEEICAPLITQLEDSKFDTSRMIIEFLLRFSNVREVLRVKNKDDIKLNRISSMYEKLGQYASHYSFILVQWALLSQYKGDYKTAEFRLDRAKAINPRSYQVSHAYGNNCLKWAIEEQNGDRVISLFNRGMDIMINDILNTQEARGDEFALHSLGSKAVKLYQLHPELQVPSVQQINAILDILDTKIRSGANTPHIRDLVRTFQKILPSMRANLQNGSGKIRTLSIPMYLVNQAGLEGDIMGDWDEQEEI